MLESTGPDRRSSDPRGTKDHETHSPSGLRRPLVDGALTGIGADGRRVLCDSCASSEHAWHFGFIGGSCVGCLCGERSIWPMIENSTPQATVSVSTWPPHAVVSTVCFLCGRRYTAEATTTRDAHQRLQAMLAECQSADLVREQAA